MVYLPHYSASRALVVGVDAYRNAGPLGYAVSDATAFARTLRDSFGFAETDITLLLDHAATREAITSSFLRFTQAPTAADDRIVVFFAGHGHTRTGSRGEVGYLVPVDGATHDLASLVRWDSLTRDADFIEAKHILFIMDACYGGLAVTRAAAPGSSRFLKDMLTRRSRQVLAAGKANELVADSGGPRAGHSIFTGHLLDALDGAATSNDGVLSANMLMAYVYEHVAKDPNSRQTPHYGFVDGDGDFIFAMPQTVAVAQDGTKDNDILIGVPATMMPENPIAPNVPLAERIKQNLSDPRDRIRLDDIVTSELRRALEQLSPELFPANARPINGVTISERLRQYEAVLAPVLTIVTLLARWGTSEHRPTLQRILTRLADAIGERGGGVAWLALQWYPLSLVQYVGGIAAISADNYENLATLLLSPLGTRRSGEKPRLAVHAIVSGIGEADSYKVFHALPDYERRYAARSEYMFKVAQPVLEDHLYLGTSYEEYFDRFEILLALTYADGGEDELTQVWGPPGRFAWKFGSQLNGGPFGGAVREALETGSTWPPFRVGFFRGSVERFKKVADLYTEQLLRKLQWH